MQAAGAALDQGRGRHTYNTIYPYILAILHAPAANMARILCTVSSDMSLKAVDMPLDKVF